MNPLVALGGLFQGDAVHKAVTLLLLLMSVGSWVVIVWKTYLLRRAVTDVARSVAAFWQAPDLAQAGHTLQAFDRSALVRPLLQASQNQLATAQSARSLSSQGDVGAQLTRVLRDALATSLRKLQSGQVLLATVGSVAPFVGLLGTVWGIYHALITMASSGPMTIEKIAGPVGEALIMTAAGLAVAIPAVLGYNIFGRLIGRIEADLDGFARDLRALLAVQRGQDSQGAGPTPWAHTALD
jgi:biopolymer transport protein ExbB